MMAHIMACSGLLGQGHAMLGTPAVPRRPLFALEVPKAKDGPDLVGGQPAHGRGLELDDLGGPSQPNHSMLQ